jgi:hypothetical protein
MSERLVSRNWDLSQLRADGYDVSIKLPAHLLFRDVPYVTPDKKVKRGILVSELDDVAGDVVAAPHTHVAYFVGERPCNANGTTVPGVSQANQDLDGILKISYQISRKPSIRPSPDFHAKMRT